MLACPWPHACQGGDGSNATAPATTNGRRLSPALALTDTATGCVPGYTGPLCAVCAHNYYFASTTTTCEVCGANGGTQLSLMVVIPMLLIVAVGTLVISFIKFGHKLVEGDGANQLVAMAGGAGVEPENDEKEVDGKAHVSAQLAGGGGDGGDTGSHTMTMNGSGNEAAAATAAVSVDVEGNIQGTTYVGRGVTADSTLGRGVSKRLKGVWKRIKSVTNLLGPLTAIGSTVASVVGRLDQDMLMPTVKIMTTAYQIVSNMPSAIDLKFPAVVTKLFAAFYFVNFTSMNFGSPQCYYKYDYVDVLVLQTVAPLVLIALLFLAYLVDLRCRTTPMERSIYVTFFFLITYLVLPRYVCR